VQDPLRDPEPLIRRVYAYAAYRLGDGPDAEDVTGETFERALRYRYSYDPERGSPAAWLVGIARRVIDDARGRRGLEALQAFVEAADAPGADLAELAGLRLDLAHALAQLSERDRELLALRYGGDLKAREIADLLSLTTSAVEVALHRALARLRAVMAVDA
jgi:RNA polymerase sigma-70 factor (ECF subfamily)